MDESAPALRIPCPSCRRPVELSADGAYRCPWPLCGRPFRAFLFAGAALRGAGSAPGPADPAAGPCAVHAGNRAEGICSRCGAFACRLCLVDLGERTLCARCFSRLHAAGEIARTRRGRMRWDSLGLILGIASLMPFWGLPLALAGCIAFALGVRARRRDPEARLSLAKLIAGLLFAGLSLAFHAAIFAGMAGLYGRLGIGPRRR